MSHAPQTGLKVAALVSILAGFAIPPSTALAQSEFILKWGTCGVGPGEFQPPAGLAVDAGGFVYVADSGNNRVQKFTDRGKFVAAWGDLYGASDVAVASDGAIYVTEASNDWFTKLASDGTRIGSWGTGDEPASIALDSAGNTYVVCYRGQTVQKNGPDGSLITTWGSPGSGNGQFDFPVGIAIDDSNQVYVADRGNNRIQKFTSNGAYISQWGTFGTADGQFNHPYALQCDASGHVYVVEETGCRIQKFTTSGAFVEEWGGQGSAAGQFSLPHGIARTAAGLLYVTDGNRVQLFGYSLPPPVTPGTYSASADFGMGNNPSGPWSYGSSYRQLENLCNPIFTPFSQSTLSDGFLTWHPPAGLAAYNLSYNTRDAVVHSGGNTYPPHSLSMFPPGPGYGYFLYTTLRWTAPSTGLFDCRAVFTGLGGYQGSPVSTCDLYIRYHELDVFRRWLNIGGANNSATFDSLIFVYENDTIDFMVGMGDGANYYDRVQPDVRLTPVRLYPSHAGNAGIIAIGYYGAGVTAQTTMALRRGADMINPIGVSLVHGGVRGGFDLTDRALGHWDVDIINPAGTTTLSGAFTIEQATGAALSVRLLGREIVRIGAPTLYAVQVTNNGNTPALGVVVGLNGVPASDSAVINFPLPPPPVPDSSEIDWDSAPLWVTNGDRKALYWIVPVMQPNESRDFDFTLTSHEFGTTPLEARTYGPWAVLGSHTRGMRTLSHYAPGTFWECTSGWLGNCTGVLSCAALALGPVAQCIVAGGVTLSGILALQAGSGRDVAAVPLIPTVGAVASACARGVATNPWLCGIGLAMCGASWWDKALDPKCNPGTGLLRNTSGSIDPNEKYVSGGSIGGYVQPGAVLTYSLAFENMASASAAAQTVVVTDRLDTLVLDLSSLRIEGGGFGERTVPAPLPPASLMDAILDLRPEENFFVRATGEVVADSALVRFVLTTIDTATGLPTEDALAGFLPPNINPPEGDGVVRFSVALKPGLPHGTVIENTASIVFDYNAPIATNAVRHTVDAVAPGSAVQPLAATQDTATFWVRWAGSDAGSGIAQYTVYVSKDGGAFTPWTQGAETQRLYTGASGSTYAFYSIATDSVGNAEAPKTNGDASTQIDVNAVGVGEIAAAPRTLRVAWLSDGAKAGTLSFRIELPSAAPASLDVMDVAGRRVGHVDVGSLGTGIHQVVITPAAGPGMYFVKLRQGTSVAKTKAMALR